MRALTMLLYSRVLPRVYAMPPSTTLPAMQPKQAVMPARQYVAGMQTLDTDAEATLRCTL
jgi:hypothetical protein